MADKRATIIRGGRLINAGGHRAEAADILIVGDTIAEVGPPGLAAPADAIAIDARDRLMHPGLINAHMHGHGNLAKGMGDRWTLELLLAAGPWITGGRTLEDKYLTTYVGAIEMLLKGCTACYDLTVEFPLPSVEGLDACGRAYADAGMRAVLAPMVAEFSFYEAIPGLLDALPPALQKEVERLRLAPGDATLTAMRQSMQGWTFDRASVRPAVAPTIPHHCSDDFMRKCATLAREFDVGLHSHVQESKAQVIVGLKRYGKTQTAHLQDLGLLGPDFTVGHGVWLDHDDMQRLGDHGASVAHNPGSNMRLGNGLADVRGMLERKVNVGIGTDGANCSDNLNMYESMRLASMVSKTQGPDTDRWLTTGEVLARRDRRKRACARLRRQARPHRARLQGRHRVPRPAQRELAAVQQCGQPARPYRGRRGGPFGDGRRPHGGRGPARRSASTWRRWRGAWRRPAPGSKARRCRTSSCSSGSSTSSTASARASPRCRITSTASAADITGTRTGRG